MKDIEFSHGAIIDDLAPGEKMEVVESKRPSGEHMNFRKALLRNVAGGIGSVSYSNMSRDYSGTYSSQRQELVEMHGVLKQHWRRY